MRWDRVLPAVWASAVGLLPGACYFPLVPRNADVDPQTNRSVLRETAQAAIMADAEYPQASWLEADRGQEPGRVGGYLTEPPRARAALVINLSGASTFDPEGPLGLTRYTHESFRQPFTDRGYHLWTLLRRECGTPYGGDDLLDVLEAIDWLEREGKAWLGVERVYLYGFSTGATLATLANRQRHVTAVVSLGGLTEPRQLIRHREVYALAALFPLNTGACQLSTTLREYGAAASDGWDRLDTVANIHELRSPELFIQGGCDVVFSPDNLLTLRTRYEQLVQEGARLAPLEFIYLPRANHFEIAVDPQVLALTYEFLARFEPAW